MSSSAVLTAATKRLPDCSQRTLRSARPSGRNASHAEISASFMLTTSDSPAAPSSSASTTAACSKEKAPRRDTMPRPSSDCENLAIVASYAPWMCLGTRPSPPPPPPTFFFFAATFGGIAGGSAQA
jgi:hypothetical protein